MIKIKLKRDRVENWLLQQKDILTVFQFEKKLGFTRGTLSKYYAGNRNLANEEIKIIDKYIQDSLDNYFDT